MALKVQTDERVITQSKAELVTIPGTPYTFRLEEVPDEAHGVAISRIGPTTKTGTGTGTCASGGTYLGLTTKNYKVQIDTAGIIGTATFKWSNTGGASWQGVLIPIPDADPIDIELDLTVQFGTGSFALGDFWVFAAEVWTETTAIPTQSMEYFVNYSTGDVLFHSSDAAKVIDVSYEGRGSLVDAEDVNQIIEVLNSGEIAMRETDTLGIALYKAVYVSGADSYGLANATTASKPAIGFVKVASETEGEIVTFGPLDGFSSLVPGTVYYLATVDGGITATAPTAGGSIKQKVGRALSTTKLFVRISDEIVVN